MADFLPSKALSMFHCGRTRYTNRGTWLHRASPQLLIDNTIKGRPRLWDIFRNWRLDAGILRLPSDRFTCTWEPSALNTYKHQSRLVRSMGYPIGSPLSPGLQQSVWTRPPHPQLQRWFSLLPTEWRDMNHHWSRFDEGFHHCSPSVTKVFEIDRRKAYGPSGLRA